MTKRSIKSILSRRSIRKYTNEPISENEIKTMLEAAMAAPSASNLKPWHFLIVTDKQNLEALAKLHPHGKMLSEAPLCIAVCGDKTVSPSFWIQDCSASTENLLLAATALKLGAVWLGVYPREERITAIRNLLNLPENIVSLNLIPIGHPAEVKEPRTQYNELQVHRERW